MQASGWTPYLIAAFDNMALLNAAFDAPYKIPNQLFIAMQN